MIRLQTPDGKLHILKDITDMPLEAIIDLGDSYMMFACGSCAGTGHLAQPVAVAPGVFALSMSKCPCCLGFGFHYVGSPT